MRLRSRRRGRSRISKTKLARWPAPSLLKFFTVKSGQEGNDRSRSTLLARIYRRPSPLIAVGRFLDFADRVSEAGHLAVFLAVLYLLLRKPTREFFRQRLASVREMLD